MLPDVSSGVASIVFDQNSGDNMIIVSPDANCKLTVERVWLAIETTKPAYVVCQLEICQKSRWNPWKLEKMSARPLS